VVAHVNDDLGFDGRRDGKGGTPSGVVEQQVMQ